MTDREEFEKIYKPSSAIFWNEELQQYEAKTGYAEHLADKAQEALIWFNQRMKAAYKKGIRWKAKNKPVTRKQPKGRKAGLLRRDGHNCFYCGLEFSSDILTIEHLIALNVGGPDRMENMVLACQPCNLEAGSKSVMEKVKIREEKQKMKFQDYPRDLQRIVELTPGGWPKGCNANHIAVDPDGEIRFDEGEVWADFRTYTDCSDVVDDLSWLGINKGHSRYQYAQCRAVWLDELTRLGQEMGDYE